MDRFRFLKWEVYQDAKKLLNMILSIVKRLPKEFRFDLGNQVVRSTFSVILNVAEGSGRATDVELSRFIDIAHGSLYETLAAVDVFRDMSLATEKEFEEVHLLAQSVANQLGGLKKSMRRRKL